jgi:hypothetical protein
MSALTLQAFIGQNPASRDSSQSTQSTPVLASDKALKSGGTYTLNGYNFSFLILGYDQNI